MTLAYETLNLRPPSRKGVIAFGTILLVPAALLAFVAPISILGLSSGGGPRSNIGSALLGAGLFFVIGGFFCWLGIDMIRARRWVRPVTLALAGLAVLTAFPAILGAMLPLFFFNGGFGFSLLFGAGYLGAVLFITLVAPGLYWWYFRRPATRRVLVFYQPQPAWTDRWPAPVFGVALVAALFAVFKSLTLLGMLVVSRMTDDGGTNHLLIWSSVLTILLLGVVCVAAIRGAYRATFWMALLCILLNAVGGIWETYVQSTEVAKTLASLQVPTTAPAAASAGGTWTASGSLTVSTQPTTFPAATTTRTVTVIVPATPAYRSPVAVGRQMSSYAQVAIATDAVRHALFLLALLLMRKSFFSPQPPPDDGAFPTDMTPPAPLPVLAAE